MSTTRRTVVVASALALSGLITGIAATATADTSVTATTAVNVRSGASTSSKIVGGLLPGSDGDGRQHHRWLDQDQVQLRHRLRLQPVPQGRRRPARRHDRPDPGDHHRRQPAQGPRALVREDQGRPGQHHRDAHRQGRARLHRGQARDGDRVDRHPVPQSVERPARGDRDPGGHRRPADQDDVRRRLQGRRGDRQGQDRVDHRHDPERSGADHLRQRDPLGHGEVPHHPGQLRTRRARTAQDHRHPLRHHDVDHPQHSRRRTSSP